MRTTTKIIAVLIGAGVVAGAGAGFTGTGVTFATGAGSAFVGGTVSQTVTGAVINSIAYTALSGNTAGTAVDTATITFDSATPDGQTVAATATGGTNTGVTWTCENIGDTTTHVSTCTTSGSAGWTGLTSFAVTVS